MSAVERRYCLNTAQLRNLHHWSEEDRLSMTSAVVVRLARGIPVHDALAAVHALLGRHEALRARLARDRGGDLIQEVLTPGGAAAELATERIDLPAGTEAGSAAGPVVPEQLAVRCALFLREERVCAVKLSLSHVFTDAFGVQAVTRDLTAILGHDPLDPDRPPQAAGYARGPGDPLIRSSTQRWKDLLADAPRSCTYSAAPRAEYEQARDIWVPLTAEHVGPAAGSVDNAARELRATPYIIWSAIISSFVQLATGQHRQVFRSTYANRAEPGDSHAVAQLAQAVYLPVNGGPDDTFRTRIAQISRMTFRTLRWGHYDAIGLLDWLNDPAIARGAMFQPAFELNYIPLPRDEESSAEPIRLHAQDTQVRIDPPSAKADLAVTVIHKPNRAVRFSVRRPLGQQRAAEKVATDCLTVMAVLCGHPDQMIRDVPVRPFTEELLAGHRSGVAVAPAATRDLVRSFPGVESCTVEMGGDGQLIARVSASRPLNADVMLAALSEKQPWIAGSVVPDRLVIRGQDPDLDTLLYAGQQPCY
jgi:hypothetical protein